MQLSQEEVLKNLVKNGYKDININTKMGNKYFNILTEFIDKYLPETKLM